MHLNNSWTPAGKDGAGKLPGRSTAKNLGITCPIAGFTRRRRSTKNPDIGMRPGMSVSGLRSRLERSELRRRETLHVSKKQLRERRIITQATHRSGHIPNPIREEY